MYMVFQLTHLVKIIIISQCGMYKIMAFKVLIHVALFQIKKKRDVNTFSLIFQHTIFKINEK